MVATETSIADPHAIARPVLEAIEALTDDHVRRHAYPAVEAVYAPGPSTTWVTVEDIHRRLLRASSIIAVALEQLEELDDPITYDRGRGEWSWTCPDCTAPIVRTALEVVVQDRDNHRALHGEVQR